ncbi:hypothetical protein BC826DRAFT_1100475 [Russula brevipes]|nr:hypothetical protein BC826DRAFT_1100475 [Russula brevipes]
MSCPSTSSLAGLILNPILIYLDGIPFFTPLRMLNVDSEPSTPASTSTPTYLSPPSLQAELDLWNLLTSSLGMDKRSQPRSQPPTGSTRRGRPNSAHHSANVPSTQASAVPSSSSATFQSHTGGWHPQQPSVPPSGPGNLEEVARALRTIQDAYPVLVQSMAHHQQGLSRDLNQVPSAVPPQPSSQLPWPLTQPPTSHGIGVPQYPQAFGPLFPSGGNYPPASAPYPTPQISTPITTTPGESSFQTFTPAQGQEGAPVDTEATAEEKRRRNTAASARFRVKKKIRTHNLEHTVSDLTGRVDELEQEAADLRRENGWLKEIVMLKSGTVRGGDSLAGPSQRPSSRDPEGDGDEGSGEEDANEND